MLMLKNGLKCVTACEDCQGESCNIAEEIFEAEEENVEELIFIALAAFIYLYLQLCS